MFRSRAPIALTCLTLLATACGVDRSTGPRIDPLLSAAVVGDPSALTASPVSDVLINLSWKDNSPNEGGFEVHRSTTGTAGTYTFVANAPAKATSYGDGGLRPNTDYCYKVRAFRTSGGKTAYSSFSLPACAKTYGPPAAPTLSSVSPRESTRVLLTWSGSDGASSYRIDHASASTGPWEQIAASVSPGQFTDTGRAAERQTCYRVVAMNQFGETASTARCTTPPAAPTIVSIRAATGGGLEVTWTDASSVEEGYEVQRANSEYQATTIATTAANATSYRDASAAPDVRYPYRVRAIKDGGYSDFSQWVEGMNATVVPDTPTGLTAYASGSTVVLVQWTASASTNGDGYRVERSANGGAWTTAATVAWAQQYIYDYDRTPDEEACYRVVAFNAKGDSPASTPDCARPIAAPTDLVATTAGSNAIDLAWSNHSAFAESYVVNRVECNYYYYEYCTVVETVTLGPDATSLRFTGLAPEGLYEFEVFAVASKNGSTYFSDPSNRAVGTTAP